MHKTCAQSKFFSKKINLRRFDVIKLYQRTAKFQKYCFSMSWELEITLDQNWHNNTSFWINLCSFQKVLHLNLVYLRHLTDSNFIKSGDSILKIWDKKLSPSLCKIVLFTPNVLFFKNYTDSKLVHVLKNCNISKKFFERVLITRNTLVWTRVALSIPNVNFFKKAGTNQVYVSKLLEHLKQILEVILTELWAWFNASILPNVIFFAKTNLHPFNVPKISSYIVKF